MKFWKGLIVVIAGVLVFASGLFQLPRVFAAEGGSDYMKRELRAVWIATVQNIDWPSRPGLPVEQQKQEFINLLDDVVEMGMNAVVVQIKPTADAFYPSEYGPWSEYITGVQGQDPGYDPLAFMIEEAHKRNLEFHAWFNPYRITMNHTDLDRLAEGHPAREHPEWVEAYGNQLYFNPGIPEAREFIVEGIVEVVRNYDIDAVHMDDYFYPYKIEGVEFPDQEEYERYGKDKFDHIDDWRRDNVNQLVRDINLAIKNEKPYVKFGISPFGVWRNKADDPTGSDTTAGQTNYDDLYADTREWIQKGYIDYITPQIYWSIGFEAASYDILADWWVNETKGRPIHLYIGQAAYKIDNNFDTRWSDPEEYPRQIYLNHQYETIKGSMHFSLKDLNRNPLGIKDRLANDLYRYPALVPAMPWLDNEAPKKPKLRDAKRVADGVEITIEDHNLNKDTAYYVIYRFDGNKRGSIDDAANILATVRKIDKKQTYLDDTAEPGKTYTYVVTAVDRLHNESGYNRSVTVK